MPQKPTKFQSKSRSGGGNFSSRDGGGARGGRGGFSQRSERDSGGRGRDGDKPRGKPAGKFGDKKFGDKPRRDFEDRPRRDFGDKPRGSFGDKKFGDKPRRDFGDKPRGGFGDKKFGDKPRRDFEDRPRRDFGDKPRGSFGDKKFGDKPRRDFEDRPRRDFGDKPRGSFGDKKFGDKPRRDFEDRPRRDYGDKPRGGFGDKKFGDKPRRDYGDKPRGGFGDKPRGGFGDKKFGDKPRRDYADRAPRAPASDETRQKLKSARVSYGAPSPAYLYGVHAVTQALLNADRQHTRLLATERGAASIEKVLKKATKDGISVPEVTLVESEDIDRLLPRDAVHQDLLLDTQPLEEVFLQDILLHADKDATVLVLDQVTDPHNVGAILRSAAAFGSIAVVLQKLHAPEITGVLAKSASGAVEHVPLVREVNLSRTITQLKDAGFTCVGLAERGESTLAGCKLKGKVAIVLGAEGDGLRRLVAESCDMLARLPTGGEIGSLNVSNAAAVALYELARLRS